MSTDKVSQYLRLINEQLKPHSEEEEDTLVGQLDLLWYSMEESDRSKAEAACKVLLSYHEGRK